MKCPKCGYLEFESGDRCRNCGYEFSLSVGKPDPLDVALDLGPDESRPPLDLDRIIGMPVAPQGDDLPLFPPSQTETNDRPASAGRAEAFADFGGDAPLVSASRPRAPLGVRRATPEVPRARGRAIQTSARAETLFEVPPVTAVRMPLDPARSGEPRGLTLAAPSSRILAALLDAALLLALDAVILYLTLRLLGLETAQIFELPLLPFVAFCLLLNGSYFIAFTAVGGQSIGKMTLGIKVISQGDDVVRIGRATVRTFAYLVSALPLGAGFLPGVISADRLALHDRLAHTRVVRPSST